MTRALPLCLVLLLAGTAHAQSTQAPLTGRMLGGQVPTEPLPPAPPAPAPSRSTAQTYPLPAADAPAAPPPAAAASATAPPPLPAATVPASRHAPVIGEATRSLLQLQASGTQAGRRQPILGDQATLSYARYLKSFEHELPAFFDNKVSSASSGSTSGN
ncbi:MAG: hypothetical protein GAK31_00050 [Stenotrophomonas maltophilia]|uniref:DUF3613 domain-containing protein n=1 Tax=Stenotrophomonas maltophilia TaxID=40324 RepID=A0A7V8FIV1_STEMA|nr:MAG: hypothetical protein GAK31_00050 [Stenotrophomonas maltophilia]